MGKQANEIDHSPVPFPPGSFDSEKLQKGLDQAAGAKDREAAIAKVLEEQNQTTVEIPDTNHVPGYKTVERTTELAPGVEVTEQVQVFDPKDAKASEEAQAGAVPPGAATDGTAPTG